MADHATDPIREAKPPATDPLTYLTILEYCVVDENSVRVLDDILLSDPDLAASIGWDLVHILLPLLPASKPCLHTVARLGNPREVILKVTEALGSARVMAGGEAEIHARGAQVSDSTDTQAEVGVGPSALAHYEALLEILPLLNSRINASRPSTFLESCLNAILPAFDSLCQVLTKEAVIPSTFRFIEAMAPLLRPRLPPRTNPNHLIADPPPEHPAPDPEGVNVRRADPADFKVSARLLQSFLIDIGNVWICDPVPPLRSDVPGFSFAERISEQRAPERIILGRRSMRRSFDLQPQLKRADDIMRRICYLSEVVGLSRDMLERAATLPVPERLPVPKDNLPITTDWAVLLLAAKLAYQALDDRQAEPPPPPPPPIFPNYHRILMAQADPQAPSLGADSYPEIDALLTLGLSSAWGGVLGQPPSDVDFYRHLQALTSISASCPSGVLRYNAHTLATMTLQMHPSDHVRLTFLRDTLEHCPYDNLKVSVVGWFKDATLSAFPSGSEARDTSSLFGGPAALEALSTLLFPNLRDELAMTNAARGWAALRRGMMFYQTTLRLYYLLHRREDIAKALQMSDFHTRHDISASYMSPLREASSIVAENIQSGRLAELGETHDNAGAVRAELEMVHEALDRVKLAMEGSI